MRHEVQDNKPVEFEVEPDQPFKVVPFPTADNPNPIVENCSELGFSKWFCRRNCEDVLYDYARGRWMVYDGTKWDNDFAVIMNRAKDIPREMAMVGYQTGGDVGDALKKYAIRAESASIIRNSLKLAESDPLICIKKENAFDNNSMLFNVLSGTIDLTTGKLNRHDRRHLLTKISKVEFDPNANCPRWKQFLEEVFKKQQDLIDFIQRAVGYSLTGKTNEQVLFFLYGIGSNGKTVFLNILQLLLCEYIKTVSSEIFMSKDKGNSATPELAQLPGIRAIVSSEVEEGRRANETLIKSLTGCEPIQARSLYGNPFTYIPQLKPWIAGNHKPSIKGTDDGVWRRFLLIPFRAIFDGDRRDKNIEVKLESELPGILNWAIEGCLKWQAVGLNPPPIVMQATAEYRSDQDTIGRWINECCSMDPLLETSSKELLKSFNQWAEENGHRKISAKTLGGYLAEHGYESKKISVKYWLGIGLQDNYSASASGVL